VLDSYTAGGEKIVVEANHREMPITKIWNEYQEANHQETLGDKMTQ
jgi:hypothetical protein